MALPDTGSLVWLEFSPQAGTEQAGRRPGIVLTSLRYHQRSRLAIVCPITNRERGWPMEVKLPPGLPIARRAIWKLSESRRKRSSKNDARLAPLLSL
ncbi:MAG: type II toxin-antitoxin system PemK/MazF family toxin [Alphaproteobacteria bacterium]|nr:type II toxin-antitoxin system PemK/MazF family toxin [Alphaproteobacteria bacterium]